jgi:N-carbamoyl-L-amino-acid hydrolase
VGAALGRSRRRFLEQASLALAALGAPASSAALSDPARLRVDGRRLNRHLAELSAFGRNPQGGVSRVAFSEADLEGRRFALGLMREAGLETAIDPAGNLLGRRAGSSPEARPLILGSHIDSVPEGGNYDGDVGSLAAIEVAQTLSEAGHTLRHPLLVAIWCDEEGGLTGSRAFVGDIGPSELREPGRDGVPLADKLRRIGGDPERLEQARQAPGSVAGYLELHIEQGGTLDERGVPIGVVLGIVGIHHYDVTLTGFANHAGTTPMDRRRNALLAASELTLAVDRIVRGVPGRQVGTVGRLLVSPGAPNVIPGEVKLTVELRDLDMAKVESLWSAILAEGRRLAERHGVALEFVRRYASASALTEPRLRAVIAEAARGLGLGTLELPSGAGHDAQELARIAPVGMIFVPSRGGISHSPREFTRPEDVENGANVLLQTLLRLDQDKP